jgi:Polyketide cyclase / dehydrase and lipid transport
MQKLDHDEVTAYIEASPEKLYDIIADVTRTPELSPEVVRCEWLGGATKAVPGARFKATNKVRITWNNKPVITVADRGREIAWSRTEIGGGTVEWRYQFEPEGSGTRVTESYKVTKSLNRLGWFLIERIAGRKDRRSDLRAGMEQTLERLRQLSEEKPA